MTFHLSSSQRSVFHWTEWNCLELVVPTWSSSSSSSSSTNFIATQVLQKLQGRYVSRVSQVSMVLLPVLCAAVWSTEQFRLQCTLECLQWRQWRDRRRQHVPDFCSGNGAGTIADGLVQRPWNMQRRWRWSSFIMILTLVLIFSVKFPENVVRFCRGHDAAKYVFFIVELFVDKILQHAILWDRPFPIKHFCPSFGVCRKNSVP